jgi:4-nitrophenyl phosphatase
MDGVIWKDKTPLADLPLFFSELSDRGYDFILATNNTTLSIKQFIDKFKYLGVDLDDNQVINSSLATAQYLLDLYPDGGPVYIVGEIGLNKTLEEHGFYHKEKNVKAVVAGLDRDLTYDMLKNASLHIQSGVPFVGTNPDPSLPTPEGLIPGTGTVLAALEAASGVKPVIIGKPAPELYRLALNRLNAKPFETLVVGDRLETDIAGGQELGCPVCVVLSGVASSEDAHKWRPKPNYILEDISKLLQIL